jgi:hypothetical protein
MSVWAKWRAWAKWGESGGATVTYSISGTINDADGNGLDGVTVTLTGDASDSTVTAGGGAYEFTGLDPGSYTVTPTKAGLTFNPTSAAVTITSANKTAATMASVWEITGTINDSAGAGLSGVLVTLSGDASATDTTDGSGAYSFPNLANGSYTVTPTKGGSTFSPTSDAVTVNGADKVATTMGQVWKITGNIVDENSTAIEGVTVTLTGDASDSTTTDVNGDYELTGLADGNYTVTPTKTETLSTWGFTNASEAVVISGADQTGEDFSGILYLNLPITIDFDDETTGQTPSWVTGRTGYKAPYIEAQSVEGHTKCLRFDQGSGATLGYGSVQLAAAVSAAATAAINATGGLRVQVLEYRLNASRQTYAITDAQDYSVDTATQRLGWDDREENNPDTALLRMMKDSVEKTTGNVDQGVNNSTGNAWTYSRFEVTIDSGSTFKVYNTSGVQQGSTHTCGWPTDGVMPSKELKHMQGVAGSGFYWRWAEIWIGGLTDDWPAM